MGVCIECGRNIKGERIIGPTCALRLQGPKPDSAHSMVVLLNRLKMTEAKELGVKVEYNFKNSTFIFQFLPLPQPPHIVNAREELRKRIQYFITAHKLYLSSSEEQLKMASKPIQEGGSK